MSTLVFPILNLNSIESSSSRNQIDFFSNRNMNKQLSTIKEFNKTQNIFLNQYNFKLQKKCKLYKLKECFLKDISIQTPMKTHEDLDLNINKIHASTKKVKSLIDKHNQTTTFNLNIKLRSNNIDNEDESNPNVQLYQSIFKINEKRKGKKKITLIGNRTNQNTKRKINLIKHKKGFDPLKYSKDTKKEMKDVKEKLKFLKGVVNYVFPHYLKFKIEPYAVNKKEVKSMATTPEFSNTFYGNTKQPVMPIKIVRKVAKMGKDMNNNLSERKSCYLNEITI